MLSTYSINREDTKFTREESGTMVMNERGDCWGIIYGDGQSTTYGWVHPANAELRSATLRRPAAVTYPGSPYEKELQMYGRIVKVKRLVTVEVLQEEADRTTVLP